MEFTRPEGYNNTVIPGEYLRYFSKRGHHYLLGSPGILFKGDSFYGPWEPRYFSLFDHNMRHPAVLVRGDTLYVAWSKVGDKPEHILLSKVDISSPDWEEWNAV